MRIEASIYNNYYFNSRDIVEPLNKGHIWTQPLSEVNNVNIDGVLYRECVNVPYPGCPLLEVPLLGNGQEKEKNYKKYYYFDI